LVYEKGNLEEDDKMGFLKDIYNDIGDRLSMYDLKGLRRFVSIYGTVLVVIVVGAIYGTRIVGEQSGSASYKHATIEIAGSEKVKEILGEVQFMTLLSHRAASGKGMDKGGDKGGEAVHYVISVQGKDGKGDVNVDVAGRGDEGCDPCESWRVVSWYLLYNGVRHDLGEEGAGPS
jgi:hypothetical protein